MHSEILPNFLFVGANKCGTTSVVDILSRHPDVFITPCKEPHFLTWECWDTRVPGTGDAYLYHHLVCKSREKYLDPFKNKTSFCVLAESSTDTFYYAQQSIPRIQDVLVDPKILIMLRNPAQRAFSAYKHLWRDGREAETFAHGLVLEEERIRQGYEYMWHYKAGGYYAMKTRLFMENFSRVKVVFFEDFIRDPEAVMSGIFSFLELSSIGGLPFQSKRNTSGDPTIKWLRDLVRKPSQLRTILKPFFPLVLRDWLRDDLIRMISKPMKLDPVTRDKLIGDYQEDMSELRALLSRPLPDDWGRA